jgi:protein-tyrosine phosphatase
MHLSCASGRQGRRNLSDDEKDLDNTGFQTRSRVVVDFDLIRKMAAQNFRDLGGHPVGSGQRVKRERLYRSSHLAELPTHSPVTQLKLKTLVTLQSRIEVEHLGTPVPASRPEVRWKHIPMGDQWFSNTGFTRISAQPGKEHLALVMHFRDDWRTFFKLLAEREVYPLLFHCSAGRDRTGVGAAMILSLLGVDRARVVADFLVSNETFPEMPLAAEQLDPVFETIDQNGGIEGFMRDVIGLDAREIEIIREDLLED